MRQFPARSSGCYGADFGLRRAPGRAVPVRRAPAVLLSPPAEAAREWRGCFEYLDGTEMRVARR
ncbi:hypothetical protein AB0M12_14520 [Nocardia vinacea]|uniref:hypothetical protein n=1 Tax=Nocardia vinacea TaxID=96468 RepID=UPI003434EDF3